tara:strand:- start:437 stop:640 length:204 start_codon:yes stop_codon:yes gene_type:complete
MWMVFALALGLMPVFLDNWRNVSWQGWVRFSLINARYFISPFDSCEGISPNINTAYMLMRFFACRDI